MDNARLRGSRWMRSVAPVGAFAPVAGLDLLAARPLPLPVQALLDEPAHMMTAWLVLTASGVRRGRFLAWALAGSVLIDVDHVPLYLWGGGADTPGGRPVTHSLLLVALLAATGLGFRRFRRPLLGLATGVALHLFRDLASGWGVPLLWPAPVTDVRVPYAGYLATLAAVTAVAAVRGARRPRLQRARRSIPDNREGRPKRRHPHSAQSLPRR